MAFALTRRGALIGGVSAALLAAPRRARAAPTKIRFLTSWFAQAEHGGFYQALATGLYAREGLDVTVEMGGPQVNGLQLLTAGNADIVMGYDIQVMKAVERKLPVVTVAASFQSDMQGLMTHRSVGGLPDLKGHKILIASSSHVTFWPWLKQRFGYVDEQAAPYTFNLQPFLVDPQSAVQAYPSSEPFEAKAQGQDVRFFLFADEGYPPYGTTMVTSRGLAESNPDAVRGFVRASLLGWRDYMVNPGPANALIQQANPKMNDARIAYAIDWMKSHDVLGRGEAATKGIGTMSADRWKRTYDFMVDGGTLHHGTDWQKAFTTQFVNGLGILPA
ncbi:ABC transporter substrate-binding protein [Methylobacterium sp. Leaf89]|uniref:ABC transporter substrate-binding protein n=1 Tax=Methylobacterium sp. Leaf89 TaxID=1736245 RepID=UPI0006F9F371|nr:ABC transporter substrate-binding protein [Methylobacterium sp. Leaf89]KQO73583.1 hypothetical protein ASF18_17595 [Methylobacterium sp. Leaf89]